MPAPTVKMRWCFSTGVYDSGPDLVYSRVSALRKKTGRRLNVFDLAGETITGEKFKDGIEKINQENGEVNSLTGTPLGNADVMPVFSSGTL